MILLRSGNLLVNNNQVDNYCIVICKTGNLLKINCFQNDMKKHFSQTFNATHTQKNTTPNNSKPLLRAERTPIWCSTMRDFAADALFGKLATLSISMSSL